MFKINNALKMFKNELKGNSSDILFGVGVSGMWMAIGTAVKATRENDLPTIKEIKKMSNEDKVGAVCKIAKAYIPTALIGSMSTICLFESKSKDLRKNAALAAAYTISETTLEEYQNKVIETVGKKKEQAIRDDIAKDRVKNEPIVVNEVINTGKGSTLCYDYIYPNKFYSSKNSIDKAVNTLNYRLRSEMYISLNDFYYELGLPLIQSSIGEDLGWNIDNGEIELEFSSQLSNDGTPMLVIGYRIEPRYDFRTLY